MAILNPAGATASLSVINSFHIGETGNPFSLWGRGVEVPAEVLAFQSPSPSSSCSDSVTDRPPASHWANAERFLASGSHSSSQHLPTVAMLFQKYGWSLQPQSARERLLYEARILLVMRNPGQLPPKESPLHDWFREGRITAPNLLEHYEDLGAFFNWFAVGSYYFNVIEDAIFEDIEERRMERESVRLLLMAYQRIEEYFGYESRRHFNRRNAQWRSFDRLFDWKEGEQFSRPSVADITEALMRGDPEARDAMLEHLKGQMTPREVEYLRLRFVEAIHDEGEMMKRLGVSKGPVSALAQRAFRALDEAFLKVLPKLIQNPGMDLTKVLPGGQVRKSAKYPATSISGMQRNTAFFLSEFDENLLIQCVSEYCNPTRISAADVEDLCKAAMAAIRYLVSPDNDGEIGLVAHHVYGHQRDDVRIRLKSFLIWLREKKIPYERFDLKDAQKRDETNKLIDELKTVSLIGKCDQILKRSPSEKPLDLKYLAEATAKYARGQRKYYAVFILQAAEAVYRYEIDVSVDKELEPMLSFSLYASLPAFNKRIAKKLLKDFLRWLPLQYSKK